MTPRVPVDDVPPVAVFLGISERSLRRQLEPGGDLEHLAYRVGRRCLVRTQVLLDELGASPDMRTTGAPTPAAADTSPTEGRPDEHDPAAGSRQPLRAVDSG